MESRMEDYTPPLIIATEMPRSLEHYTKMFGIQPADKTATSEAKTERAPLGFDAPVLVLTPEGSQEPPATNDARSRISMDTGFEFHFGTNGSGMLDEFIADVEAKGIMVIREPQRFGDPEGD